MFWFHHRNVWTPWYFEIAEYNQIRLQVNLEVGIYGILGISPNVTIECRPPFLANTTEALAKDPFQIIHIHCCKLPVGPLKLSSPHMTWFLRLTVSVSYMLFTVWDSTWVCSCRLTIANEHFEWATSYRLNTKSSSYPRSSHFQAHYS